MRLFLLAALLFSLLLGGLASFNPGWLQLAVPLAVYLFVGFLTAPGQLKLSAERAISEERVAPGQPVKVELKVTNLGENLRRLCLRDLLPENSIVLTGSTMRMLSLKKGETVKWTYTFSGSRGFHALSCLETSAGDLFSLITVRQNVPTNGQILIMPAAPRIRRISIRTRATRVYSGTIPAHQGGPGVDFFGIREYQPGDPMRVVNWRVSAHQSQEHVLYANEFEQERVADVGIILDARRHVNQLGEKLTIFDDSILAAASLSDAFLSSGNRVGLLIYGQYINWTLPGYGKRQRELILHALARALPGNSQAFSGIYIPGSLFPSNSQLVFISPLVDDDVRPLVNLRALGYALIVVSPNAIQLEAAHLHRSRFVSQSVRILSMKRRITLQRLRHAGVQVVDWDTTHPFDQVVESALSRPPSFIRAIRSGIV